MVRGLILALLVAAVGKFSVGGEYLFSKVFAGIMAGCLIGAYLLWTRLHWSAALAFLWSAISCSLLSIPTFGYTAPFAGDILFFMRSHASHAWLLLTMTTLPLVWWLTHDPKNQRSAWYGLALICLGGSAYTVIQSFYLIPFHRGGLFFNASLNASMIAVLYPILVHEKSILPRWGIWIKIVLPVAACLLTQTTAGCAMIALSILLTFGESIGRAFAAWGVLGAFGMGYLYFTRGYFVQDSGRIGIWKMCAEFWNENVITWLGSLQGSAYYLIPAVQQINHPKAMPDPRFQVQPIHDYFLWAHNDWLQVWQEQGYVGLALWSILAASIVVGTIRAKNKPLLCSVILLAFMALGNYPARMPATAIVAVVIGSLALLRYDLVAGDKYVST